MANQLFVPLDLSLSAVELRTQLIVKQRLLQSGAMVENEGEEGGQLAQPRARHIKKRALKNKALSVSFNEKDLRFAFKLHTNLVNRLIGNFVCFFVVNFCFSEVCYCLGFCLGTMSLDFTRGRRKGERKQRSNRRKLSGGSASKIAKRFDTIELFCPSVENFVEFKKEEKATMSASDENFL